MKKNNSLTAAGNRLTKRTKAIAATMMATVAASPLFAQTGNLTGGLAQIKTNADTISTTGQQICYAIAVIIGIVGAVRILSKQSGDRENLHKEIAGWFGATLFFAAAGVMIRALMA